MMTAKEKSEYDRLGRLWATGRATKPQMLRHMELARKAAMHSTETDADRWRIFFRCEGRRRDGQVDVEADSLAMAESKAEAYATSHGLRQFRILCIAPLAVHQYRQAGAV